MLRAFVPVPAHLCNKSTAFLDRGIDLLLVEVKFSWYVDKRVTTVSKAIDWEELLSFGCSGASRPVIATTIRAMRKSDDTLHYS